MSSAAAAGFRAGPSDEPDRYQLGPAVAAGSEGVLYRAQRMVGGVVNDVAVKMLHPGHHAAFDRWSQRWLDQARLLATVAAPGLVTVREAFVGALPHAPGAADVSTRSLYLVMDWIDGQPLWDWVRGRTDEPERLLLPLVSVATALDLLHSGAASGSTPLIHGDVKPGNILMVADETAVLVDLGSVRAFDSERMSGVTGTAGYLAPETLQRGEWSTAADRYALGCVAIGLLIGNDPPVGADAEQLRLLLEAAPTCAGRTELVEHCSRWWRRTRQTGRSSAQTGSPRFGAPASS